MGREMTRTAFSKPNAETSATPNISAPLVNLQVESKKQTEKK